MEPVTSDTYVAILPSQVQIHDKWYGYQSNRSSRSDVPSSSLYEADLTGNPIGDFTECSPKSGHDLSDNVQKITASLYAAGGDPFTDVSILGPGLSPTSYLPLQPRSLLVLQATNLELELRPHTGDVGVSRSVQYCFEVKESLHRLDQEWYQCAVTTQSSLDSSIQLAVDVLCQY